MTIRMKAFGQYVPFIPFDCQILVSGILEYLSNFYSRLRKSANVHCCPYTNELARLLHPLPSKTSHQVYMTLKVALLNVVAAVNH